MNGGKRVALVTGGNRGIGFETCRQLGRQGYRVILASRDEVKGERAAASLQGEGLDVTHRPLDVTSSESIAALAALVLGEWGAVDVLVNNAAIYPDEGQSVLRVGVETFRDAMETNVFGPLQLCQALVPQMVRRRYGRVVNVSSGAGQLEYMNGTTPAYSLSKLALNGLTLMVAGQVGRGSNVLVNALDPGWVRTEMGGSSAPRSVEQGADTVVWLATLPNGGPHGGFFHDRKPISW
jgi:NAD(P)-dependent dehydrogenase (short-subunit alcohol dehydrogenase family)